MKITGLRWVNRGSAADPYRVLQQEVTYEENWGGGAIKCNDVKKRSL